jgi:hypothetical protein
MSDLLKRVTTAISETRANGGGDEEIARAAISAIRNPTDAMIYAMTMCEDRDGNRNLAAIFKAAIDAATTAL